MADKRQYDLDDALDFVGRDARHKVVDAVYCVLFNAAGTLEGNTEKNDVEWLARRMYEINVRGVGTAWDYLEDDTKNEYLNMSKLAIQCLPLLTERIANRYRAYTDALHTLVKAEREAVYKG
jgi:hypothetical protein